MVLCLPIILIKLINIKIPDNSNKDGKIKYEKIIELGCKIKLSLNDFNINYNQKKKENEEISPNYLETGNFKGNGNKYTEDEEEDEE